MLQCSYCNTQARHTNILIHPQCHSCNILMFPKISCDAHSITVRLTQNLALSSQLSLSHSVEYNTFGAKSTVDISFPFSHNMIQRNYVNKKANKQHRTKINKICGSETQPTSRGFFPDPCKCKTVELNILI